MARPREFDVDTVLSEAMQIFWEKGFEGTSFAEIETRTGIKKASLFAAYGDKRGLFLKALARYQEEGRSACATKLAGPSPLEALERWFTSVSRPVDGKCIRRGCLQVNTVVELAQHDEEIAALAGANTALLTDQVAAVVGRGQEIGEIRRDVEPRTLAQLLVTTLHGLSVAAKAGMPADEIDRIVSAALLGLRTTNG